MRIRVATGVAAFGLALAGCGRTGDGPAGEAKGAGEVVIYSALDQEFAEPILEAYERKDGVRVVTRFDVESTKTVGLTQRIIAEANRPRCDLFWNNEILNTLRLKEKGLLTPFRPANAAAYPATFKASDGSWYGFAARARILLVNTDLLPLPDRPTSIRDLTDPTWKGQIGLAKPLFGTTATHAACLFAAWGSEDAKGFFAALKANDAQILAGNKQVAQAVGKGQIVFGLTDTDDALGEIDAGSPVVIVYPDRGQDELGTLFIPNTLAIIKNAPHAEAARALANHLLGPEVEEALARGPSGQIPLNAAVDLPLRVETPRTVHAMEVDFETAAGLWNEVAAYLAREFAGG